MKYKISVISGDGIGPEITKCSIGVMKSLEVLENEKIT